MVKCEKCMFWDSAGGANTGKCCKRAPVVIRTRESCDDTVWPITGNKEGCGEGQWK